MVDGRTLDPNISAQAAPAVTAQFEAFLRPVRAKAAAGEQPMATTTTITPIETLRLEAQAESEAGVARRFESRLYCEGVTPRSLRKWRLKLEMLA